MCHDPNEKPPVTIEKVQSPREKSKEGSVRPIIPETKKYERYR